MRKLCVITYRFLLYCMLPLAVLRLVVKAKGNVRVLDNLSERFGFYHKLNISGPVIWVHAVSVGETGAASDMVEQLPPDYKILFSVTTASARAKAEARFKSHTGVTVIYFPYDIPSAIKRLLAKFDVALFISMETEIWPNLYTILAQKNIALLLANARLSSKSCRKYAKFRSFFAEVFAAITCVAAQDKEDARRLAFMGARNIKLLGSMKYDIKPPAKSTADLSCGMLSYFAAAKTLISLSTHDNEEEIMLAAFTEIKSSIPESKLILVPRHPARAPEIIKLINASGFKYVLYSEHANCNGQEDILLVDRIGVLADLLQVFDVAYMGGSLIPRGGQNLIEPASHARPVLMGPSRYNFYSAAKGMSKTGGLLLVNNAADIAREALRLFNDEKLSKDLGQRLLAYVNEQTGSTKRHVELIKSLL